MRTVWSFKVGGTGGGPPRPLPGGAGGGPCGPDAGAPCGGLACWGWARGGPPRVRVDVASNGCDVAHVATQCSVAALRFCAGASDVNPRTERRRRRNVVRICCLTAFQESPLVRASID